MSILLDTLGKTYGYEVDIHKTEHGQLSFSQHNDIVMINPDHISSLITILQNFEKSNVSKNIEG